MERDYHCTANKNIIATDVTYIPAPRDINVNHVYLSVAIHHKTKKIFSWNLNEINNTEFILEHHKEINYFTNEWIIHSDHGFQYSLFVF
ncbi:hypothetical protein ACW95P_00895 [Candidatus Mycoplasma pogonae]